MMTHLQLWFIFAVGWFVGHPTAALGSSTANVTVGDNFFSPRNVTNTVGDSVQWNWEGINSHSSTGPGVTPLWNSGIHGNGFVFTQTFPSAGTLSNSRTRPALGWRMWSR